MRLIGCTLSHVVAEYNSSSNSGSCNLVIFIGERKNRMISEEVFAEWSLKIGLVVLISYMAFIMYRLAKDSKAGKTGMLWIFIGLGAGVLGFIIKEILVATLEV